MWKRGNSIILGGVRGAFLVVIKGGPKDVGEQGRNLGRERGGMTRIVLPSEVDPREGDFASLG